MSKPNWRLQGRNPRRAIFALSNTILLGTLKAVEEAGLNVPDDLSVISFDNYTYLDFLSPAITRVNQPIEEMGILAVKILLQALKNNEPSHTQILLPPNIIVRNSVRLLQDRDVPLRSAVLGDG